MRVVFMGNPAFALPTLKEIISSNHEVVGVVSNPPKPMGRGRKLKSTPVGIFAKENGLQLIEAVSLNSEDFINDMKELKPDIFVVVAFRILPQSLIDLPTHGAVNLHASILPKYRGAGPIQWALMNGDTSTGVTIFQISKNVDTGNILRQKEMKIEPQDTMLTLGTRLCTDGAPLVVDALNAIDSGHINPVPQNHLDATKAPKISKEMTIIDWTWSAEKIHNWCRGLSPFPGLSTTWNRKRLRIFNTNVVEEGTNIESGKIHKINDRKIFVGTGEHLLAISDVQLEGKKRMSVSEFLKGNEIQLGDQLGK